MNSSDCRDDTRQVGQDGESKGAQEETEQQLEALQVQLKAALNLDREEQKEPPSETGFSEADAARQQHPPRFKGQKA